MKQPVRTGVWMFYWRLATRYFIFVYRRCDAMSPFSSTPDTVTTTRLYECVTHATPPCRLRVREWRTSSWESGTCSTQSLKLFLLTLCWSAIKGASVWSQSPSHKAFTIRRVLCVFFFFSGWLTSAVQDKYRFSIKELSAPAVVNCKSNFLW